MSEQKPTLREWVEQREAAWLRRIETEHEYRHMPECSRESDILTAIDKALELHDAEVDDLKADRDWLKQNRAEVLDEYTSSCERVKELESEIDDLKAERDALKNRLALFKDGLDEVRESNERKGDA